MSSRCMRHTEPREPGAALRYGCTCNRVEAMIEQWRALPEDEKREIRKAVIPARVEADKRMGELP